MNRSGGGEDLRCSAGEVAGEMHHLKFCNNIRASPPACTSDPQSSRCSLPLQSAATVIRNVAIIVSIIAGLLFGQLASPEKDIECCSCGDRRLNSAVVLPPPSPPASLASFSRRLLNSAVAPPPPSPPASLAQFSRDAWEQAFHPLWMTFSGLYTCWHMSLNHKLAGLAGTIFLLSAFASVGSSMLSSLSALNARQACRM